MKKLNLRTAFEDAARKWVKHQWQEVVQVDFDAKHTWGHGFDWRETLEGNVTPHRASIVYHDGISWEIKRVKLKPEDLKPTYAPEITYECTYDNTKGSEDMEVKENWSGARTIENAMTVTLSQKLSLGYKLTTRASLDLVIIKGGAEAESSIQMDLGAEEKIEKTVTEKVEYGASISFTVRAGKSTTVRYAFERGKGDVKFSSTARASGWFYTHPKHSLTDPGNHVYPWSIDNAAPEVNNTTPMPEEWKSFKFSGTCSRVSYHRGSYTLVDETGADITNQVQMVTAPESVRPEEVA